jgi:exopolyphosphatase/guanosine-5'-triphosphate,3'-diphosphate pyrophosphatase
MDGKVNEKLITKALIACLQELEPVKDEFLQAGWQQVIGASGSIKAVAKVCQANGWSDGTITLDSLEKIIAIYLNHGKVDAQIAGLSEDRQPVFLGGVMVLSALFEALELKQMVAADWALREGLLFDQKGRLENHDIRQASVDALAARFHVNMDKARAVEKTALNLLSQVAPNWQLTAEDASKLLGWAARLYQVGLDIAHNDYHKHSAYIVQNVDLAGCSRAEQTQLAALVLAHRKRFPAKSFPLDNSDLVRLAILLRMAAIFHRGKIKDGLPTIAVKADGRKIKLILPAKWIEDHPLTQADLETEQRHLSDIGYDFQLLTQ